MSKLVLIDGHALAYRAYFALQTTGLTTSSGEPTHAVYGFCLMLLAVLEEEQPDYMAVTFDVGETFRHEQYPEYKATRDKAPEDMHQQIERIKQVVAAFGLPILTAERYEADDVLGTIARQAEEKEVETLIVTGDRDTFQLITPSTKVLISGRRFSDRQIYDEERVKERYEGLTPEQLVDMKGLMGDSSDNIPGVKGVGVKTATKLLKKYGTLEEIYEHLEQVSGRFRSKLKEGRELAFLSRELGRIVTDAPVELDLDRCRLTNYDRDAVREVFRELEFRSLLNRLPASEDSGNAQQLAMFETIDDETPLTKTIVVRDEATLQKLIAQLHQASLIALDTETTSTDPLQAELVGISLAVREAEGYYIPLGHEQSQQLSRETVFEALGPILAAAERPKAAHNASYDIGVLEQAGLSVKGLTWDTMIAEWLISPAGEHGLKAVAFRRLGIEMTPITDLIGKGAKQITMAQVPIAKAAPYAAADADLTLRLVSLQEPDLDQYELRELFDQVEMPLVPVIVAMERNGIKLDTATLDQMAQELGDRLNKIEEQINGYLQAPININSTQQLSQALFEELGLPTAASRKTKTGYYSTAAGVLEKLRGEHPIIELILQHRELSKLLGTYIEALPKLVNPDTGRIHTSFNQTGAVTGRISSSNPNLQNIPMRTELGRKIRRAFVAGPRFDENSTENWRLVGADYSQVELRVLAHLCQDPAMIEAFQSDMDIHAATAAAVYGTDFDAVSPGQRSFAKRVNFGLLYGMSTYRLAQETGMPRAEADAFVKEYFDRFPGVEQYLEETKRQAAEQGYVETLLGRRRYFPILQQKVKGRRASFQRAAAEREAINMPVQGTAADIMKIAMRRVYDALREESYRARLLLQVHDELVLEMPVEELERVVPVVRQEMMSAYELVVPLKVDVKVGQNWYEMEEM